MFSKRKTEYKFSCSSLEQFRSLFEELFVYNSNFENIIQYCAKYSVSQIIKKIMPGFVMYKNRKKKQKKTEKIEKKYRHPRHF